MFTPKVSACAVFYWVQGDTRATLVFAEGVAHRCNRLHWTFVINILRLDWDNAIVVVNFRIGVCIAHRSAFQLYLLFAVQNDIEKCSFMPRSHLSLIKPAWKNRQLFLVSCYVARLEELFVIRGYGSIWTLCLCKIFNEKMLAKWSISVFYTALVLNLKVEFV